MNRRRAAVVLGLGVAVVVLGGATTVLALDKFAGISLFGSKEIKGSQKLFDEAEQRLKEAGAFLKQARALAAEETRADAEYVTRSLEELKKRESRGSSAPSAQPSK